MTMLATRDRSLLGAVAPAAVAAWVAAACAQPATCASSVLAVQPSPDLARKAVVYARSCDRRQMTINVSIVPTAVESGAEPGNAFIYIIGPGVEALGVPGIRWKAPDRLQIRYDSSQALVREEREVAGVHVDYLPLDAPEP